MREKIRLILNILIVLCVAAAWTGMILRWGDGNLLTTAGFANLKYFTVLSNLLEGLASLVFVIYSLNGKRRARNRHSFTAKRQASAIPDSLEILKYVAAVAVGVTLLVVMGMFGPLYGYMAMLGGANLFFHLVVPVLAILEVLLLAPFKANAGENVLALIPTILYAVYYVVNMILNGVGEWPDTNDWYGFLNWGIPGAVGIAAGIFAVTYVIGLILRKAARG